MADNFQAIALYSYQSAQEGDLTFAKNDVISVTERDGDWWYGYVEAHPDTIGMFPSNYVKRVEHVKSVEDVQEMRQDTTVLRPDEAAPEIEKFPRLKAYWAQEGPKVVFIILYLIANLVMFFLTFEKYRSSDEKAAIRDLLGYGVIIARSCGAALRLNCALLLVCVLRNQLTWLRSTILAQYLPLDKNIVFHKNIAFVTAFLAVLHTCAHYVNLINFSKNELGTVGAALLNVPDSLLKKAQEDATQKVNVHFYAYATLPGWTGHALLLVMVLIYGGTFQKVRRSNFEVFWYSHHFFIPFYGLLCAHGFAELLEPAQFWYWGVGPMTLYALERLIRLWRSRQTTIVEKVRKHPSGVMEVQMRKRAMRYNAGMYLWLNSPYVSYWEWHPFTISSAPQEANVSVHIKCCGDWTKAFARLLNPNEEKEVIIGAAGTPKGKPLVCIDGPYGTGAQEFTKYDVLMLVGAGIGVTPFSSILKAVGYNIQRPPANSRLKKVYFYWIMRDRNGFEWIAEMLAELESVNEHGVLEIHNYLTGALKPDQIKDIMFAKQGPDPVTGLRNPTHYGRPNWDSIFAEKAKQHQGGTIGVFFCGPRVLSKKLYATSRKYTDLKTHTKFAYHKENF
eukprot:TRINITY_DN40269_c0_g1_i1.p1 TRINITY_DN40269_c0_g1~~TRINITY_DN40269_c0_g1_i1.p1  ORF type:complete len:619 (+),score=91.56 TRINITY_DN40269_c0_g1_i1:278-2134(+)